MRKIYRLLSAIIMSILMNIIINAQTVVGSVSDYDGNVYHAVRIGNQIWLQENMRCTHYPDGTLIPGVAAYNNTESNAAVYGRLYTWDGAMKNSHTAKAQGIAPAGYHIPSDDEWTELEVYLGGVSVAGGKMKTTGTSLWNAPNTDATNSSGMSILPGGEYDAYYSPNQFQALGQYGVFWTSTEINSSTARERYYAYNSAVSGYYDWYKVMKYSIRCIKDNNSVGIEENKSVPNEFRLNQNYPNPFNPSTVISFSLPKSGYVTLKVFDLLGREIKALVDGTLEAGVHKVNFTFSNLSSGVYVYTLTCGSFSSSMKMIINK